MKLMRNLIITYIMARVFVFGVDVLTGETKKIDYISKQEPRIIGTLPIGWDLKMKHEVHFKDGKGGEIFTRDYDFPIIRKISHYKSPHPKEGDRCLVGGLTKKVYWSAQK